MNVDAPHYFVSAVWALVLNDPSVIIHTRADLLSLPHLLMLHFRFNTYGICNHSYIHICVCWYVYKYIYIYMYIYIKFHFIIGNQMIDPLPVKKPWIIWTKASTSEMTRRWSYCHNNTKHKPCFSFSFETCCKQIKTNQSSRIHSRLTMPCGCCVKTYRVEPHDALDKEGFRKHVSVQWLS